MEIISWLKQLDERVFFFINSFPHNLILEKIFLFFSFYPLIIWFLLGILLFLLKKKKDIKFVVRLGLALVLAGIIASGVIKPIVKRPRPDISFGSKVILVQEKAAGIPANNDYAFPSGHAAIAFAGAYILLQENTHTRKKGVEKQKKTILIRYLILTFAFFTAFSRIYLGKHYPLDVLVGATVGWVTGMLSLKMSNKLFNSKNN